MTKVLSLITKFLNPLNRPHPSELCLSHLARPAWHSLLSLSSWKSSWYEFFRNDKRVLSSERLNTDFLNDSDKKSGSMSPNNDGRNVFLWMVFMGFIFVSLVVLERVMEVPQI